MYARITRFQMDPSREAEVVAQLDEVSVQLKAIPGMIAAYSAWRSADGQGVTTGIYESKAAAEAAAPEVQRMLSGMASLMTSPPSAEEFENVRDLRA